MKINIFYFTGTGFTERVGKALTKEFVALGQETKLHYIPELLYTKPGSDNENKHDIGKKLGELDDADMIGIMYPVHSFNAPEVVVKFAGQLPFGNGRKAFIVKTAGDKAEINAGSSILLMKILTKRGYQVTYEELVQMPTNFAVRYEDEFIIDLVLKADELVKIIAEEIIKGRNKPVSTSIGKKVFATATRIEWLGAHVIAKFCFNVEKTCNLCGVCVKDCPAHNISVKKDKITFGTKCTFCMRCIYTCPQKAIHLKKPLGAIEVKDWFDIEELLKNKDKK